MWIFHQKMRILSSTLNNWSKSKIGDIHTKANEYEEKIRYAKDKLIFSNIEEQRMHLHCLNAEYIKFLKLKGLYT